MKSLPKNKTLTISQAAEYLNVSKKTLRRWEDKEILTPQRTKGGHRRYNLYKLISFKKKKGNKRLSSKSLGKIQKYKEISLGKDTKDTDEISADMIKSEIEFKKELPELYNILPKPQKAILTGFLLTATFVISSFFGYKTLKSILP
ncbi:MAG: MerR family DNA-binding transcriptional regulator, partial [Candidatus Woesebacteria bacterium]